MSATTKLGFLPASLRVGLFGFIQDKMIFQRLAPAPEIKEPREYAKFFPSLRNFSQETLNYTLEGKPSQLGLWIKKPANEEKPIYIVFHGLGGNWADRGRGEGKDRHFRLSWLHALVKTGAGVIAVHPRGHGLSRVDEGKNKDLRVGEKWMQQDIQKLAEYLVTLDIDPKRMIIAGESMGGALATMLAEEMTLYGKPPAVLGLINSFADLAGPSAHIFRKEGVLPALPRERGKHSEREQERQAQRDLLYKHLKSRLDTGARFDALDRGKTMLYIANTPGDDAVPFEEQAKLVAAADKLVFFEERKFTIKSRKLENDYLTAGANNHTRWNPTKVTKDLQECFEKQQPQTSLRLLPTMRMEETRSGRGVA
jgi:hypothetical protein